MSRSEETRAEETRAEESRAEESRAERRRRLDRIFGEGLPEQTEDDTDEPRRRAEAESAGEEWLRRQVPPHHG